MNLSSKNPLATEASRQLLAETGLPKDFQKVIRPAFESCIAEVFENYGLPGNELSEKKSKEMLNEFKKKISLLLTRAKEELKQSPPVQPHPPSPSPSPFKKNGLAAFASNLTVHGALKAMFSAPKGWKEDYDGRPFFVHEIDGKKMKGKAQYYVLLPKPLGWENSEEENITVAHKELAWKILEDMGVDTAWLHLLCLAYAVEPQRRGNRGHLFRIPQREVYRCLNLDKRTDLTREERDRRVRDEVERLSSLGLQMIRFELVGERINKNGHRETAFNWENQLSRLWDIGIRGYGQGYFDWEDGKVVTRYEDWQLVGREGLWGDIFLHGEKSLRQFGYLARQMLDNIDRRKHPFTAALAVTLTFKSRFDPGVIPSITNREIINLTEEDVYLTDRQARYNLKNQLLNAIEEQEKWGWEPDYSEWEEELCPYRGLEPADNLEEEPWNACPIDMPRGYWDKFLCCRTHFKPQEDSPAGNMFKASLHVKHLSQAQGPFKKKNSKAWTATQIQELRKKHDLTQKELASYLGVSRVLISHFENARRSPTTEQAKKFTELRNKPRE